MIRRLAPILALLCGLAGCADEGGSRGSGIFSELGGNVASVDGSALGLQGIKVSLAGTALHGDTDATGHFELAGAFDGPVQLLFQRPADDLEAALALKVPAGGTLTLMNVRIQAASHDASVETQHIECTGILTKVACPAQRMTMVSAEDTSYEPHEYVVQLDTSIVVDSHGNSLDCTDLHSGQRAGVSALVETSGVFGHGTITIAAP